MLNLKTKTRIGKVPQIDIGQRAKSLNSDIRSNYFDLKFIDLKRKFIFSQ